MSSVFSPDITKGNWTLTTSLPKGYPMADVGKLIDHQKN